MRVLIFGSRSLTWKHVDVFGWLASHAMLKEDEPLADFIDSWAFKPASADTVRVWLPEDEPLILINGDGPPGKERGAIGADKLALFACMRRWDEKRRRVRWLATPDDVVRAKPERCYCVHTNLESSEQSSAMAEKLQRNGLPSGT